MLGNEETLQPEASSRNHEMQSQNAQHLKKKTKLQTINAGRVWRKKNRLALLMSM